MAISWIIFQIEKKENSLNIYIRPLVNINISIIIFFCREGVSTSVAANYLLKWQCGAKYNSVDAVLQLCKMGCNSSFVNRIGETAKSMAERLGNDLCKEAIDNYTGEYDTDSDEDDFFQ